MKPSFLTTTLFAALTASAPVDNLTPGFNLRLLAPLENRSSTDTRNELLNGPCKPITVIFARGTIESGNVGTIAGPPFFNALDSAIGASQLAIQGINYPATIAGYLAGGDTGGATTFANLATMATTNCPSTKIVLSGYSQGAQEVHLAAPKLSASVAARVIAVVMFGDPDDGKALPGIPAGNVDTICHPDDLICDGLPIVGPSHLTYGADAGAAAAFVKSKV